MKIKFSPECLGQRQNKQCPLVRNCENSAGCKFSPHKAKREGFQDIGGNNHSTMEGGRSR